MWQPQAFFAKGPRSLGLRGAVLWPITWPKSPCHKGDRASEGARLGHRSVVCPWKIWLPNMGVINPWSELWLLCHSICPSVHLSIHLLIPPSIHPIVLCGCLSPKDTRVSRDTQRDTAGDKSVRVGEGVLSGCWRVNCPTVKPGDTH